VTLLVFCCVVAVDAVMPVMIYFKEPPAPLSEISDARCAENA